MASITSGLISSAGVGSGIDINSLVSQLVQAQKQPEYDRLDAQQTKLQTRLSSLGTLKSALSSLQDAAFALWKFETFNSRTVSTGTSGVLSATADPGVLAGNHQISFDQLAQAQQLSTDPTLAGARFTATTDVVGTGTLTFRFGTTTFTNGTYTSFTPDSTQATQTVQITDGSLQGVANAINSAGIGVRASIVYDGSYYRLMLQGANTGAANSFEITAADNDGNSTDGSGLSVLGFNAGAANMKQIQAAQNTVGLMVDGIPITSASNTLDKAIAGMTITLQAPGSTTVSVGVDQTQASQAISAFVDKYNALVTTMNQLSSYDPTSGQAGPLIGDNVLLSVDSQIRRVMGQVFGSTDTVFRQLADIGITRNPQDGTLVLDSNKLQASMSQNYDAVAKLMSAYGKPLDDLVSNMVASNGLVQTATDGINSGLKDIADQRTAVDQRAQTYQAQLTAQFTAMDALVAQLRSTSDYLTQQFSALNNLNTNK
jgi:flagellar hook-associated protein 2